MDGTLQEETDEYTGAKSSRPECYAEVPSSCRDEAEGVSWWLDTGWQGLLLFSSENDTGN